MWNYTKDCKKPTNTDCLYLLWFGDNDYETAILNGDRLLTVRRLQKKLDNLVAFSLYEDPLHVSGRFYRVVKE